MEFPETEFEQDPFYPSPFINYPIAAWIEGEGSTSYDFDAVVSQSGSKTYFLATKLYAPFKSYSMGTTLVYSQGNFRTVNPNINAIYWSFAHTTDDLLIRMQEANLKFKLIYAGGEQLDEYFGETLGLRRRYQETDFAYRQRLSIHVAILTSSGTINDCGLILDSIVGINNSAIINTYWPSNIVVNWSTPDAMMAAEQNSEVINDACNKMFPTGASWTIATKHQDYYALVRIYGDILKYYEVDTLLKAEFYANYDIDFDLCLTDLAYDYIDSIIEKTHIMYYIMAVHRFRKTCEKEDPLDAIVEITQYTNDDMDVDILKSILLDYDFDSLVERTFLSEVDLNADIESTLKAYYLGMVYITLADKYLLYNMDVKIGEYYKYAYNDMGVSLVI